MAAWFNDVISPYVFRCRLWWTVKTESGNIPVQAVSGVSGEKKSKDKRPRDVAANALIAAAEYPNCGAKTTCTDDQISVQLYTGTRNKDPPKICVDGS